MIEVIIRRGNEKYIFRYKREQKEEILNIIADQAKNESLSFDWYDAAILSHIIEECSGC